MIRKDVQIVVISGLTCLHYLLHESCINSILLLAITCSDENMITFFCFACYDVY